MIRHAALGKHAILALVLLGSGCSKQENPTVPTERPNLVFIVTDDQRFDMMGTVNPILHTPNMDHLATAGARFENAFVTSPICAASRASLLTGVVERTHRFTFGTPPLSVEFTDLSYPTLLRAAGYHTGFVGKFGVNTGEGATDTMFDAFVPLRPDPYFKELDDGTTRHLTDITADESVAYLRSVDRGHPFALTVSFNAPHAEDADERQYIWPEAMDTLYSDLPMPEPPLSDPAFFAAFPEFLKEASLNRVRWYWRFDTPEKARRMTRGYYRMISGVDAAIGRVLGELESLGMAENTVILLMGDNGYFLGERGYAGKWLPYEQSIRVPLIVFDPRGQDRLQGSRPSMPVLNIDIAPTLLDLAGVEVPAIMQGRSLAPFLAGETPADWREVFFVEHLFEHPEIPKHEGVRGERFKYARYFEQVPVYEELYDIRDDPLETRNLSTDPDYGNLLEEMRIRTDELRDEYGGPFLPVREPRQ
ncbi:MAG: sulfatase [Gemmatimonadetes bacterium]|nr:sulfatase [Gemmatimonadota bacterium]NNM03760.1 sulfatase [Gemmatimonadota bacterium]